MRTLYNITAKYHQASVSLLTKHQVRISKQEKMTDLKSNALGQKYNSRIRDEPMLSRSISTATLRVRQVQRNNAEAHSKYRAKVLDRMKTPLDKKVMKRRSSLISFLDSSKVANPLSEGRRQSVAQRKSTIAKEDLVTKNVSFS